MALLATMATAPLATAATGGVPGPNRADVDAAVAFRAKLGLRSDRAFVASSFTAGGFSSATWGIPLDPAEATEIGRRAKLQKDLAAALKTWADDPAYAGAYLDHRARGAPVFLTTADPAKGKAKLGRSMPAGANARFLRVDHSMAELLAVQDRVNADLGAGLLAPQGVVSTAIDARANAVIVGVAADPALVRAALVARFGGAVEVRFEQPAAGGDACSARDDCMPAKGGTLIRSTYNGNTCTIGFLARVAGSSAPRILTAGHCIGKSGNTGTSRTWTNDGQSMGWAELYSWTDGADADIGVIAPTSAAVSGDRNLLYRSSAADTVQITGWRATASQIQGGLVCRSAAVSGYHCGTIELTNRSRDVDGQLIDHQWVVDFDACPGDSGAPYFSGTTAYGLHTDSTVGCEPGTNQAWYTPIGWALSVLKSRGHPVELCMTAACGSEINVWTQRGSLGQSSWNPHLVNLDDGRVLAVGGTYGDILAGGAVATGRPPELFDPGDGTWSDAADPPWAPATCDGQFAVRLKDGRVLVGGGRNIGSGGSNACDGAHLFDPDAGSDGSWKTVDSPPVALASAGAALLGDGRAFVTGGTGAAGTNPVAIAYSPSGGSWTTLAAPPAGALAPLVLALHDGRVLVSGGYTIADGAAPGYADAPATHLYNPSTNSWAATTSVGARGIAGVVLDNGRAVVAGGQDLSWDGSQHASFLTTARSFNPATNAWTTISPLLRPRAGAAIIELGNGLVLAAGGRTDGSTPAGGATRTTEVFDAASNRWLNAPSLVASHGEAGVAVLGNGSVLMAGGGTSAAETYTEGDLLPPTAGAPGWAFRTGSSMSTSSVPTRVSWTGADTGGAGVGTYDVARSVDGGAFATIATRVPGTSLNTTTSSGHTYRYQVRPRDWADNVGAWSAAGTKAKVTVLEQTSSSISYPKPWLTNRSSSYSNGSVRYSSTSGRSVSYTFTGRGIAWVSARGPSRGSAKVYIDGVLAATVSTHSSAVTYRYVAFQRSWGSSARHTIKIVVVGTSGHPRVDLDAFEILTNP